jgi:hypothetical protein
LSESNFAHFVGGASSGALRKLQHLLLKFFWARLTLSFFFRLQRAIERSFSVGTQWGRSSANGRTDHSAERRFYGYHDDSGGEHSDRWIANGGNASNPGH